MPCRYSNNLFALKECRILHPGCLTSNTKIIGSQVFNEHIATCNKLTIYCIYEIQNKEMGSLM